jgi:hypothetical protein
MEEINRCGLHILLNCLRGPERKQVLERKNKKGMEYEARKQILAKVYITAKPWGLLAMEITKKPDCK